MNRLFYGDCLDVMQGMQAGSVDLIYLDPPFNSQKNYHSIYKDETGRSLPDQVEAFCDMWTLTPEREREIRHMPILVRETGIDDETAEFWKTWMNALRKTNPALLAYLSYMVIRLVHMKVLLRSTGSLYLHCDPTAAHYIKVMLDGVFGHANFRNEIVWRRYGSHNDAGQGSRHFGRVHDTILWYSKSAVPTWNQVYSPLEPRYVESTYSHVEPETNRRFSTTPLTGPGGADKGNPVYEWHGHTRAWRYSQTRMQELEDAGRLYYSRTGYARQKLYLEESKGVPAQDVWSDIKSLSGAHAERMGYATQKPIALLERIIKASTNEGDVVLDPFCGCATTLEAAHRLNRKWIGIDIAIHAVKRVARIRLTERCGLVEGTDFEVRGVPRDVEGAHDLWKRNPYHFQKWAVEQIDGFVTTKQTADGGIDGRLYFAHPEHKDLQSMVIEVKGGATVNIADVRALGDVLQRSSALLAGLIAMDVSPGKAANFGRLMAEAGDLDVLGVKYPRMQMLTVPQILAGERFQTPSVAARHIVSPRLPGT